MKAMAAEADRQGVDFEIVREGGAHTIVRVGAKKTSVPRHNEIPERTANKILKQIGAIR